MDPTPDEAASTPPKDETPSQKQARLRRERRQAKIQAEGSSRLAAITNLSGRRPPAAETPQQLGALPTQQPPSMTDSAEAPDPAEGDIASHHYAPRTTPRLPPSFSDSGRSSPQPGMTQQQQPPGPDDPMMRMLQQMIGNPSAAPNPSDAPLPPGLADLFSAAQRDEHQSVPSSNTAAIWRIIHALFSFLLAAYIVYTSSFSGSKLGRTTSELAGEGDKFASRLFLYFATGEAVLQSSRYFVERGNLPGSGVMAALSRMLPEPWAGYVRVLGRYSVIYTTLVADAMVVVFVLGVVAWWGGAVEV